MSFFTRSRQLPAPERTTTEEDPTTDRPPAPTRSDDPADVVADHVIRADGVVVDRVVRADGAVVDRVRADALPGPSADPPGRVRAVAAWVGTGLACLLVLFALLAPNRISALTPWAFLRIPVDALLGLALLLVLPPRARRPVAVPIGVLLGLTTILKIVDMGFYAVLARPFNPVLDWISIEAGVDFLTDSIGRPGTVAAVIGAVLLVVAVPVLMTMAVLRLTRLLLRYRIRTTQSVIALGAVCVVATVLGVQVAPQMTVSSLAYDRVAEARTSLRDRETFAAQAGTDAFADTPGDQLLTGLRGKDVLLAFVESYGRDAVEDPEFAPQVGAVLDAGYARLRAAGYSARSGFLTSPTFGGGSWLAHATLLSGLWIDNQQRYDSLVASDRLTLNGAFQRADWRTVGVMPGVTQSWPEGAFFGYDKIHASADLGYRGPKFSWAPVPDQYTLSVFERAEHSTPSRPPVMATIPLVSSHAPWAPIPEFIDWNAVGDGSVYQGIVEAAAAPDEVWRDNTRVRAEYRRSIEYTLHTLISYVETYGDENLVLVFLGDHQPTPMITGEEASRDVPVTIVAHDPAVLDRIAGWNWQHGLRPGAAAPVWPMSAFRDRFLTAFAR